MRQEIRQKTQSSSTHEPRSRDKQTSHVCRVRGEVRSRERLEDTHEVQAPEGETVPVRRVRSANQVDRRVPPSQKYRSFENQALQLRNVCESFCDEICLRDSRETCSPQVEVVHVRHV